MNKILYIALSDLNDESDGVSQKIKMQLQAFRANGMIADCIAYGYEAVNLYSEQGCISIKRFKKYVPRRICLFESALSLIKQNDYNLCYIRFPHMDLFFIRVLKLLKKHRTKIFLEVPSYPIAYSKFSIQAPASMFFYLQDKLFSKRLKKYVYRCVSIGKYSEKIFGVRNINIPNGINVSYYPENRITNIENKINIISVSNLYSPHGYDRLIKGLINYYKEEFYKTEINILMVGTGPEKEALERLCIENNIDNHVFFYGKKFGQELNDLFNLCNMACGPLAIHRKGAQLASPLKTKEYFARGIPFIYAYDEIGLPDDYPFALKFSANDEPIEFDEIIEFYERIKDDYAEISKNMRRFAKTNYSWEDLFNKIIVE